MFRIEKFAELIGNTTTLIEWKSAITNIKSGEILFIRGASGTGKTLGTTLLAKELHYNELFIDTNTVSDGKNILDRMNKFHNWTDLTESFSNTSNTFKKIIIIDEVESFVKIDRNVLNSIVSYNKKYQEQSIPIILIGHDDVLKKLGDMKHYITNVVKIQRLNDIDIFLFFKKRIPKNRIKLDVLMKIVEDSNGNIYSAVQTVLCHLQQKKNTLIMASSYTGDEQKSLHEIFECKNPLIVEKLLSDDDWINPLKIHENIIKILDADIYRTFLKDYLYYEEWHTKLENSIDSLTDIHIMYLSFVILSAVKNQNTDGKIDTLDFSKLLSYVSTKKKYKKLLYDKVPPTYPIDEAGLYWIHEHLYPNKNKSKKDRQNIL